MREKAVIHPYRKVKSSDGGTDNAGLWKALSQAIEMVPGPNATRAVA